MKTKLLALGALFASLCISVRGQPTPVLHLSFDNVSGSTVINDGSGSSAMDGTLNGTATIVGGGKFGNCLQVLGVASSDASCRIANAVVPLNVTAGSAWTVGLWIKTTTQGGTWAYQGDGGWAANDTTLFMALNNGSAGNASHAAGGVRFGQGWQQGTTAVDNGQWHHIVFTFDGTNKVEYVDGVLETWVQNGWAVGTGDSGVGGQFWIGGGGTGQGDGQVCLNGLIDEAYVFDVALSASDVSKLYDNNSLTIVPVPVAVTVNPDRGLRGTVVTVTATATPASGTVTNAVANLSALGLTNALQLVQSSVNVFTNSFTVPNNAPIGLANVLVRVIDTEPLVGSGATNFFVLAVPPTNAIVVTELTSKSAYQYTEVSFHFAATNDAPNSTNNAFFPMTYSWYTNGVLVSTNRMGPYYTFLTTPDQNLMSIQSIARINDDTNYYSSLSVTSALVTLTVNAGTPEFTNGLKQEVFSGVTSRANVEIGNTPPGVIHLVTAADSPGGFGDNTSRRYSGYFIPPTTDAYVFFVAGDDDTDVFLSTNSSPANKRLIAQETTWSGTRSWLTPGPGTPGPYEASQKRSDQWSPDPGNVAAPYAAGIPLVAGQKYYFESVEHNGGGGDNWAVTYETLTELTADSSQPVNGSASRMTAESNNIAVVTWPGTTLTWAQDLTPTNVTILEGNNTNFTAVATSDAEMAPVYQWYIAGAPYPGVTGTNFALSNIPLLYNNAQIYVVARIEEGSLVITSRVAILHVTQAVREAGFIKDERFDGKIVNDIITGNLPSAPSFQMAITEWGISVDNAGGHDNFARRVSGYFKPPTTGLYTFYVTSDDDSILFLSTDSTPGNKRQIASQGGWNSGGYRWATANGGGVASQTVSDTFTINSVAQNPGGIMLTQGQRYYIEQDMHQGGGGANLGATYTMFGDGVPAQSSQTALRGSVIEMTVTRCSFVAFTQQPQNVANAALGTLVAFSAAGTTDSQVAVGGPRGYEETFANSKLFFQWFTNGVPVTNANSSKFLMGPVTADMVGVTVMCQTRALGYTDDALNPIWTNSTSATILNTVAAPAPSLRGHWISGAASLADTANVVGPGVYDGLPIRATTSSRYYYFTNDVPPAPGATNGAQSLYLSAQGITITNTGTGDPGYVTDTFDGGIQNGATVMFWAKGWPSAWNPWVSKYGENGIGWQLRTFNAGPNAAWTMRGTGGNDDMQSSVGSNDGQWHHYAGTWDGTTFTRNLYVDGTNAATTTGSSLYGLPSTSHLAIGARDAGGASYGNYFTGKIYDVRIYNYPLTQSEVLGINGLPLPFTSEVVAGQLVLTWPVGTLLQATNLLGPWTTNSSVSPATIDMTEPMQFFRVKNP
jgi:Concanavalin A-like lectin/glucanases superfamily/PA14 domain